MVRGIAAYFCVNDNLPSVLKFNNAVKKALFKWLNRRSQRGMNWEDFLLYIYSKKYPKKFNVKVRPDKGENIRR